MNDLIDLGRVRRCEIIDGARDLAERALVSVRFTRRRLIHIGKYIRRSLAWRQLTSVLKRPRGTLLRDVGCHIPHIAVEARDMSDALGEAGQAALRDILCSIQKAMRL
ncbi:MAG: hypothetical protein WDN46_14320 [Methylocella sp.]